MPIIQIPTAFNIDLEFEIAEFHKRLLAYFIRDTHNLSFQHEIPVVYGFIQRL